MLEAMATVLHQSTYIFHFVPLDVNWLFWPVFYSVNMLLAPYNHPEALHVSNPVDARSDLLRLLHVLYATAKARLRRLLHC